MRREQKIMQCHLCNEHCPQEESARDIALGRMYATKELIACQKELQQYRAIGTVEECRAAVEKQKAKKPDFEGDGYADGLLVYDTWICPCCGKHYEVDYDDYDFCPNCGQAIDLK